MDAQSEEQITADSDGGDNEQELQPGLFFKRLNSLRREQWIGADRARSPDLILRSLARDGGMNLALGRERIKGAADGPRRGG
jgi:hypothetical protein